MNILVTGAAGFIGSALSKYLLKNGHKVLGIDNFNDYYDPKLKHDRIAELNNHPQFSIDEIDIADTKKLSGFFKQHTIDIVVNLAAQAGVRYSIENPSAYTQANLVGFANILECSRQAKVKHLVFASSSSVYGSNTHQPFSEHDNVDHPISFYAATKKANEVMAHSYAHLYGLPCTGLRFFTVYGPWGRPDMALFKFTKNIIEDTPIEVYNEGNMIRDFTYIDDIVEGIYRVMLHIPTTNQDYHPEDPDPATSDAPYNIYNIGNQNPVNLMDFIHAIEDSTGKKANIHNHPMQAGDVPSTFANVERLEHDVHYHPATPVTTGIEQFVNWYQSYYHTSR